MTDLKTIDKILIEMDEVEALKTLAKLVHVVTYRFQDLREYNDDSARLRVDQSLITNMFQCEAHMVEALNRYRLEMQKL